MPMLDAFNTDTFGMVSLTNSLELLPFKPARIGELGIFQPRPIATTTAVIEEKAGKLALIQTSRRGEPALVSESEKRTTRSFVVPHIKLQDTITAETIQNLRAFGSETELMTLSQEVNDRMARLKQDQEVTLEHLRAGTLKGVQLDADGTTVLFNFFTEFGITPTVVDMNMDDATQDMTAKLVEVKRAIDDALGSHRNSWTYIQCLCGRSFYDDFTTHARVRTAYERWNDGAFLRSDMRGGFEFGDTRVRIEEYSATVSGVDFMNTNEAIFFPVGVPEMFETIYAPADYIETVNTRGRPMYAKMAPGADGFNRAVQLEVQQNPLCICKRPGALIKAWTNSDVYGS